MPSTTVSFDIEMSVVLERPKVAVSAGPLGTPFVQLSTVFQSPEMGSIAHWVLIAYVTVGIRNSRKQRIAARISVFISNLRLWYQCERLLSEPAPPHPLEGLIVRRHRFRSNRNKTVIFVQAQFCTFQISTLVHLPAVTVRSDFDDCHVKVVAFLQSEPIRSLEHEPAK